MISLRAFIAIQVPQEIKTQIMSQTVELRRQAGRSVRWGSAENIHVTLKFLGDVSLKQVDLLSQMLNNLAQTYPPFDVVADGLGIFPNLRRPRVIWVGLHEANSQLTKLQQSVEAAAAQLGHAPENKSFSPHLTIGRVREPLPAQELLALQDAFKGATVQLKESFTIRSVDLMRSELKPAGPLYTCLSTAVFGG